MSSSVDGVLVQWGDRLFYPCNRSVQDRAPRLHGARGRAQTIRARIEATVRRAPQVMVKVTGGGRGMKAIAAHFRYISKNGRLEIEDDRGVVERGREILGDLDRQWRYGGALIDDDGDRREAFNVMLSMQRGIDPLIVQKAAREFAKIEFADHRYVMVLHDHQANPHVHLSVKAESKHGVRLNPRKADLHRWREVFAQRLQEWGIDAEATRQVTRGRWRSPDALWRRKAKEEGRRQGGPTEASSRASSGLSRRESLAAWRQIALALETSDSREDRALAKDIVDFVREMPVTRADVWLRREMPHTALDRVPGAPLVQCVSDHGRKGPNIER